MTPLTLKLKLREKYDFINDKFRALDELNYNFIYLLAIKLVGWGVKSFSQSTDMMQASYNQHVKYMTPLT